MVGRSIFNFDDQLKIVQNHLHSGRTEQATDALSTLNAVSPQQSRMIEHYQGKILMRQEKYYLAKRQLAKARQVWGDHIGLIGDMAMCAFLNGQVADWEYHVREMAMILKLTGDRLCLDSFVRSSVLLAKFHEELGEIVNAERILAAAHNRTSSNDLSIEMEHFFSLQNLALANLLRINALFFSEAKIATLYSQVMRSEPRNHELQVEVEHSLLLVEMRLIGRKAALQRLVRIWPQLIHSDDRRLLAWEYLEYALRHAWPLEECQFLYDPASWLPSTVTERDLLTLCRRKLKTPESQLQKLNCLTAIVAGCTVGEGLRFIAVLCALKRQGEKILEHDDDLISQSRDLLLRGLDSSTKQLWSRHFEGHIDATSLRLSLNSKNYRFSYLQSEVSLKRSPTLFLFAAQFVEQKEIPLAELSQNLWNSEFNESFYHRFRMQVGRLNDILEKLTGIQNLFSISKDSVKINEMVEIQVSQDI